MPWLIILSEKTALEWVLQHQRMAFRAHVPTTALRLGAPIALYVARGAFHSPKRDESHIAALGQIASEVRSEPVEVAGEWYQSWCGLTLELSSPLRRGLPFRPLVDQLEFIKKKQGWSMYLKRTLVQISDRDFSIIKQTFIRYIEDMQDMQGSGG
jgi:hypothetical protein